MHRFTKNNGCRFFFKYLINLISVSESYSIGLIWLAQYFKSAKKWIFVFGGG